MSKPLWQSRFSGAMDKGMFMFSKSLSYDIVLLPYDLRVNKAWAGALKKAGVITEKELKDIQGALAAVLKDYQSGSLNIPADVEDVHTLVEHEVTKRLGETGRKLHTGKSRNDQVATDLRLYLLDKTAETMRNIDTLVETCAARARAWHSIIIPGYTHVQHAQPVSMAHHMLAYAEKFSRDRERLDSTRSRIDVMPLGSGALAGVPIAIDRDALKKDLGFSMIAMNSLDAVSDRDFAAYFLADTVVCALHLSSLAEELVLWSSKEFGFVSLPDTYCTGSSLMPQKKNPDAAELIRGKTGRHIGNLMRLLTILKGLPLSYNRDLQEDKEAVFDSVEQINQALIIAGAILAGTSINKEAAQRYLGNEYLYMTDIVFYLVKRGLPFRTAYEVIGSLVKHMEKTGMTFSDIPLEDLRKFAKEFDGDVYGYCDPAVSLRMKKTAGSTAPDSIKEQLEIWDGIIAQRKNQWKS